MWHQFIEYILGREYAGSRIGPEPTTDKFIAIFDGTEEKVIPGNALAVSKEYPYGGLDRFGVGFLNRFEGSQVVGSPILKNISFIDTPGVLSGEKQRLNREYDYMAVTQWFASRSDLIVLLFDAHKLDISDEFRAVIHSLKGHTDKIRCVLNKVDQVCQRINHFISLQFILFTKLQLDNQHLMRVYGSLMWSMGKVISSPEAIRVYVGSFWGNRLQECENAHLMIREEIDLKKDLLSLPRCGMLRKINDLAKRARLAKVHAFIISHIMEEMPVLIGKDKKHDQVITTPFSLQ
jgi:hypothetical protein